MHQSKEDGNHHFRRILNITMTFNDDYVGKSQLRNLLFLRFNNDSKTKLKHKHKDKVNNDRMFEK